MATPSTSPSDSDERRPTGRNGGTRERRRSTHRATAGANAARDYQQTVEPRFRAMFDRWARRQGAVTDADLEQLLARVDAAVQPVHLDLDEAVGPFYDTNGLSEWIGASRQALDGKRKRNSIIACQLEGGRWVYPTWQFDDEGSPHQDLIAVWRTLRGPAERPNADPWTCALWLRSPHPELNDRTPADSLLSGGHRERVHVLARRDAARWAR